MLKYIFYTILCLSGFILPQSDSSDLIIKRFNNQTFIKTKKSFPLTKGATTANLIIEFDTINFNYTKDKYYISNTLPIFSYFRMPILDADKNGKLEYYGSRGMDTAIGQIYELGKSPKLLYTFNDTLGFFWDVASIKNDGIMNFVATGMDSKLIFYKQNAFNSLITEPDFVYHKNSRYDQPENVTFYDIDGDGIQELIYYLAAGGDSIWSLSNIVAKYNPLINNYEMVYYNRPYPDFYTFGIVTGDFDNNGKRKFATGSTDGKMYVYEYEGNNKYKIEFQKELECYNLYLEGFSNDMDGNGKPELWMAGDFSSSIYGGMTRIFAFEPDSNWVYKQVYQIDIRGLFSAIIGNIRITDFDNDGKQELMVRNAAYMFFFKSRGIGDYYCDFIYRDPFIDTLSTSSDFWGTDAKDLDGDGIPELINFTSMGPHSTACTFIYKKKIITDVSGDRTNIPKEFNLYQNYPNPFNGSTIIKFSISKQSDTKLIIRDILGREIKTLVNEYHDIGVYDVTWDGKDNSHRSVGSGVYIVSLITLRYNKSIKVMLLK
jgi:WD40 repeat protein